MAELTWDGKYRDGKRVAPVRIALPFQTIETVNESAQDRRRTLDLFASGRPSEWRNRLIWGDKKYVLPSLLPEFAGKVNLIYIDPPFDTGADFSFVRAVPGSEQRLEKVPSIIEQKAYRDTWGLTAEERARGTSSLDKYMRWFHESAALLVELLSDSGTLFVHVDHRLVFHVKVLLDELLGPERFLNIVTWRRQIPRGMKAHAKYMPHSSDFLLMYSKGESATWNEAKKETLISLAEAERKYMKDDRGFFRTSDPGTYSDESLIRLHKEGRIYVSKGGEFLVGKDGKVSVTKGTIGVKYYRQQRGNMVVEESVVDNVWDDIPGMGVVSSEWVGYPTQKPEALLERIITASTNDRDVVLDCFGGSGTTGVVAEKLKRRWIVCDLSRFAIHTARKRLLGIPGVKPFVVQNLGKYERQAWMKAEFEKPEDRAATEAAYRRFILDLFKADAVTGNAWIHGVKGGRAVHIGAVDAPVTLSDVKAVCKEVWQYGGAGKKGPDKAAADILGWDFAFELNEVGKQLAAEAQVDLRFRYIPKDVMDKQAVDQGDIQPKDFFELRALDVKATKAKRTVKVTLTDFMLPAEDLPEEVRVAVKHWSQWIDYWAVDWNFRDDTFHNEWQTYRTRERSELELDVSHEYADPGEYVIVVKVIDILGNDTTRQLAIEVR